MSEVAITRTYDASREEVWRALTEPDDVARWWGPDGFEVPRDSVDIDLRPGGRLHLVMIDGRNGQEFPVRQDILEVTAPELLVLRHEAVPEHGLDDVVVTRIELHEQEGGTRMEVTGGPYSEAMGPMAQTGWEQQLERLVQVLA